jgi:hypothetical protein
MPVRDLYLHGHVGLVVLGVRVAHEDHVEVALLAEDHGVGGQLRAVTVVEAHY